MMNIDRRTCMHAKVDFPLNGKLSTVVCGLARYGVVGVYCEGSQTFKSIDLSSGKSTSVNLNFRIANAFAVDLGLWMVTSIKNNPRFKECKSSLYSWTRDDSCNKKMAR